MPVNRTFSMPLPAANRRQVLIGATTAFFGLSLGSLNAQAPNDDGISRSAASIHQEPVFKATPARVYQILTNAREFDNIVRLSGAMQSGALGPKPAEISSEVGGPFSLFGGYVTGRIIELSPNERIVQAWRPQNWKPGEYSIVKFDLKEHGTGTAIVLDHRGFPDGLEQHLAEGWKVNYWEPLEKYLSAPK